MKLLIDEMLQAVIAEQLRRRGHDVDAVTERSELRGLPDRELFALAQEECRAFATEDIEGFSRAASLADGRGQSHYGLILIEPGKYPRARPRTIGRLVKALDEFLRAHPGERATSLRHWL